MDTEEMGLPRKLRAVWRALMFRPVFALGIAVLSVLTAVMEGVGLSFLLPIIRIAQGKTSADSGGQIMELFVSAYDFIGLPLTLETAIYGVAVVMVVRYLSTFLVSWFSLLIRKDYVRYQRHELFENALNARTRYFDTEGSDELLNTIITQTNVSGKVITQTVDIVQLVAISAMYLAVAVYIAPMLSIAAGLLVGVALVVVRLFFESGATIGSRAVRANEDVHSIAQAGMQGIRAVKLYNLEDYMLDNFDDALDRQKEAGVTVGRNSTAMNNLYRLIMALSVFVLLYAAIRFTPLSIAGLGIFVFSVFRLAPRVSKLNNSIYALDGKIPHLARTQRFIDEMDRVREQGTGEVEVPETVTTVAFDDVSFSYREDEGAIRDVSFQFGGGEFVAFVGPSGAGKSTIVSLLARLYEPDEGEILANGTPIDAFDIREWRSKIAVVSQQPYIFNDTLRYNLVVGNRDASRQEIERVCEIAQVSEFIDDLPDGYDTVLGDDGVRLSGGQRQRVATARALLKDADLLVFDEATSDLDTALEEKVHSAIEEMDVDCGLLVVAHRLSTVRDADRIYAMEDGEIQESGTHDTLLESDGTYSNLYARHA